MIPFLLLNFYSDKINNLLSQWGEEFNIFIKTISDSKEDINFNSLAPPTLRSSGGERLKENSSITIKNNNNSINNFNNSTYININTFLNSIYNFSERDDFSNINEINRSSLHLNFITNFNTLQKIFYKIFTEIQICKTSKIVDLIKFNIPIIFEEKYKLSDDLIRFLDKYIDKIIFNNKKILDLDKIINFINNFRFYNNDYDEKILNLEKLIAIEYKKYLKALNSYTYSCLDSLNKKTAYEMNFNEETEKLNSNHNRGMNNEVNNFNNSQICSKLKNLITKLRTSPTDKKQKQNKQALPTTTE